MMEMTRFVVLILAIAWTSVKAAYLPISCSFESSSLCSFSHDINSDFYWIRGNRYSGTSTTGTGPPGPYSGTYFLYTYARNKQPGAKSYLRTPTISYDGPVCVSFYYHMYDSTRYQMGTLKVFTTSQGERCPLVNLTGHQSNSWRKATVQTTLSSSDRVIFLGIRGNGTRGDIGLDLVSVRTGLCAFTTHQPVCGTDKSTGPLNISLIISAQNQQYRYRSSYYTSGYENVSIVEAINGDPSEWVPQIGSSPPQNVTRYTLRNMNKLGLNFLKRHIVWSDSTYGDISYGTIDSDVGDMFVDRTTAHYFASPKIGGIAIDWVADNMYWTDLVYKWVMMTRLQNGTTEYYKVIDTGIQEPMGICVHPAKSYLFWSDKASSKAVIERSDLLGRDRKQIIKSGITSPILLDLDYKTDRLYWVDINTYMIESCLLDGSDRKVFLKQQHFVLSFVGMTIYNNYLFCITGQNQLFIMDTSKSPAEPKNITLDYNKAFDIIAFGEDKQENLTSPCTNIECDGICVGTNNNTKAECVCPEGKELYNGKTCLASRYYHSPMYAIAAQSAVCLMDVFAPESYNARSSYYYASCDARIPLYTLYEEVQSLGNLFSSKIMYFGTSHNIYMRSMRTLALPYVLIAGAGDVKAISVDWIAKNIYWTDGAGLIKVANYRGKYRMVLVKEEGVSGLVVDPTTGYMYWSNTLKQTITKAKMDGSNPKVIMTTLSQSGNLTLDYSEQRLYWADSAQSEIFSMDTNGSDTKSVASFTDEPFSIAVYKNHIAWTSSYRIHWTYKGISLKESLNYTRHSMRIYGSGSIILYGEYSQPSKYTNKCATKNGGCVHMCLTSVNAVMCKCGLGFELDTDKKSCKPIDIGQTDMIITTMAEHKILAFNTKNNKTRPLPLKNVIRPAFIAVDAKAKMLFWVDIARQEINKATLTGQKQSTILTLSQGKLPYGLAIDPLRKMLFYGTFNRSISSMDYDGLNRRVVIGNAMEEGPLYLAVDIYNSKIYWSNWGKFPGISVADYGGQNKRILVDGYNMLYPTGLFLDTQYQVLYWADAWIGRIESIQTNGLKRTLLYFDPQAAYFGLTGLGKYLYVTDQNSSYVKKIPKVKTEVSTISNLGDPIFPLGSGIVAFDYSHPIPPSPSPTTPTPPTKPGSGGKPAKPTTKSGNNTDSVAVSAKQSQNSDSGLDTKDIILIGVFSGLALFIIIAMTLACSVRSSRTSMLDRMGRLQSRLSSADSTLSDPDTISTSSELGAVDNMYK